MKLNLDDLGIALSHTLDFMEIDFLGGVSNHSKRVAYMAQRLARRAGLGEDAVFDLVALAILHDNGIGVAFQRKAEADSAGAGMGRFDTGAAHCIAGQENLEGYPFLTGVGSALKHHHENWDGSGFFSLAGEEIPLLSRIIRLADMVELTHRVGTADFAGKEKIYAWLAAKSGTLFDPALVEAFRAEAASPAFWLDLSDEYVGVSLRRAVPRRDREMTLDEVRSVTALFSRIVDSKSRFTRMHSSELSERASFMADRYGFDASLKTRFIIAADLHDVGKLMVPNEILEKPGKLDPPELDVIQRHTYFTRVSLESIAGFDEIVEWASNHHEKLDGSGYPYGKGAGSLDFNSRLLACLDIYQALTEDRPYRAPMPHEKAVSIMSRMAADGKIDAGIVSDIDAAFA